MRRASLSDRHNLCRKEYETEAIVWRGGREEEEEKEKESDQENKPVVPVSTVELKEKIICMVLFSSFKCRIVNLFFCLVVCLFTFPF